MCNLSSVMSSVPRKSENYLDTTVETIQDRGMLNNRKIANTLKSIIEQLTSLLEDLTHSENTDDDK